MKSLLHNHAQVIRQKNGAASKALCEAAEARLSESIEQAEIMFQNRRLLREMGQWLAVPHSCPAAFLHKSVSEACRAGVVDGSCSGRGSPKRLSEAWHRRHLGIREPSRSPKVKGVRRSECWKQGCCLCRSGAQKLSLQTAATLRQRLQHPPLSESLLQSKIFCLWLGSSEKLPDRLSASDPSSLVYRLAYIPLQYLKPWRPTFMEVSLESSLAEFLGSLPQDGPLDGMELWHTVCFCRPTDRMPLYTPFDFARSLDSSLHWSILLLELSGRSVPWVESVAKVKARVCCGTFLEVWSPEAPLEVGFDTDGLWCRASCRGQSHESGWRRGPFAVRY